MDIRLLLIAFFGFQLGCSGLVAPTNEAAAPTEGTTEQTSADDFDFGDKDDEGSDDETDDEGTEEDTTTDTRTPIGTISEISGDLDFTPVTAYATISEAAGNKTFTVTIMDSVITEDDLTKVVKEYECTACDGECETGGAAVKSFTVSFTDASFPTEIDSVDDNGMPSKDNYERTTPTGAGISIFYSDGSSNFGGGKESGDVVTFATRPSAVGEEFEFTIDATMVELTATDFSTPSGTWKATINSNVVETATQTATYPECEDGEYANPIYED